MKYLIVFILFVFNVNLGFAATYYVSNSSGQDGHDGKSPEQAWKTLAKVNGMSFHAGDNILFKRGDIWREHLITASGNASGGYITYDAYGEGNKPNFRLSMDKSRANDWVDNGGHIWQTTGLKTDVGNIFFDGDTATGQKVFTKEELVKDLDYWWDPDKTGVLLLYSTENPAKRFKSIECGLTSDYIVDLKESSYVIIQNLDLSNSGNHGIRGQKNDHIIIRKNDVHNIGGSDAHYPHHTRQGDGIEFWQIATNIWVYENKLWEIYDVAMSSQFNGKPDGDLIYQNQYWFNNIAWKCCRFFEFFATPPKTGKVDIEHIYLFNNTFYDAGGWGAANRPDKEAVRHIEIYPKAPLKDFYIVNNIFDLTESTMLYFDKQMPGQTYFLDHNIYWSTNQQKTMWRLNRINSGNFNDYVKNLHYDEHSLFADPLLVGPPRDFNYQSGSPALNAGMDMAKILNTDIRPYFDRKGDAFNIGAQGF